MTDDDRRRAKVAKIGSFVLLALCLLGIGFLLFKAGFLFYIMFSDDSFFGGGEPAAAPVSYAPGFRRAFLIPIVLFACVELLFLAWVYFPRPQRKRSRKR